MPVTSTSVALTAISKFAQLAKLINQAREKRTSEYLVAWDSQKEDWLLEVAVAAKEQKEHLEAIQCKLDAIDALLSDPQFHRIFDNYSFEASREAINERRRMLACAAAGSIDPTMSVAEIARTERTIRELDPQDVLELHRLSKLPSPTAPGVSNWSDEQSQARLNRYNTLIKSPSFDALLASGCVYIDHQTGYAGATPDAEVTSMGHRVLRILRAYIKLRDEPIDTQSDGVTGQ
ncbi:hypothetical protein [Sorangium sp. So ce1335]|uniref:hypothetical protein n=1 Tax=Sorangium sp. So ce1335 TaxID=3133335 RepID=UPI003F5E68C4